MISGDENPSPQQGLFDKLYMAGKELFKLADKPLVKSKIKRKLQAAHDDAQAKINEAKIKINKTREDFDKYDVNIILEQLDLICKCETLQENIQAEYKTLFKKDMVFEED